jgi:hypothetical protein
LKKIEEIRDMVLTSTARDEKMRHIKVDLQTQEV